MMKCKAPAIFSENLLSTSKQGTSIPFKIALCAELGFFETEEFSSLSGTRQREVLKMLLGGSDRIIKGNLAVLNSHSKENPTRYTASQYLGEVRKFLNLS